MIKLDEQALICDFAETYHIYQYRALPLKLAATLAAGLREDSRIIQHKDNVRTGTEPILLATIADRLGSLLAMLSGSSEPPSIAEQLLNYEYEKKKDYEVFDSAEDFDAFFYGE